MNIETAAEIAELLETHRRGLEVAIKAIAKNVLDDLKADAPRWKKGDRAFVEVEVTGGGGNNVNVVIVGMTGNSRGITVPSSILEAVDE
jgi:hypothetical protein